MALAGLKPVVEMRVVDFALCAIDEIVNQAAKNRLHVRRPGPRAAGRARMPIGIWAAIGRAALAVARSLVRAHAGPGGRVPGDAGRTTTRLLRSGARQRRPGGLHGAQGRCGPARRGRRRSTTCRTRAKCASRARRAATLTLVSWSRQTACVRCRPAEQLAAQGVDAEVIAPAHASGPGTATLVLASAARTGRAAGCARSGAGGWLRCRSRGAWRRRCRLPRRARLGGPRLPVGCSQPLEAQARVDAAAVVGRRA